MRSVTRSFQNWVDSLLLATLSHSSSLPLAFVTPVWVPNLPVLLTRSRPLIPPHAIPCTLSASTAPPPLISPLPHSRLPSLTTASPRLTSSTIATLIPALQQLSTYSSLHKWQSPPDHTHPHGRTPPHALTAYSRHDTPALILPQSTLFMPPHAYLHPTAS